LDETSGGGSTLIEIWQANAAGRYHHEVDQHRAPLDLTLSAPGAA
jgi:protocatechuate 3,4-dioxygenase beta subunit